jgi:hypothetical protein
MEKRERARAIERYSDHRRDQDGAVERAARGLIVRVDQQR